MLGIGKNTTDLKKSEFRGKILVPISVAGGFVLVQADEIVSWEVVSKFCVFISR